MCKGLLYELLILKTFFSRSVVSLDHFVVSEGG